MRILIVKTSALGDIIHAYPVLHYLKLRFPKAKIDWVVEERCRTLVENHPMVNQTIVMNSTKGKRRPIKSLKELCRKLRLQNYDLLFDLQGNMKSALVTLCARADRKVGFGRRTVSEWPNLLVTRERWDPPKGQNIRDDYLYLAQSHFGDFSSFVDPGVSLTVSKEERLLVDALLPSSPVLLVCPGANWRNKVLPKKMLKQVVAEHSSFQVLFTWGTEEEKTRALSFEIGQLVPKLSLAALQYLMGRVDKVIAMDSLPLHLAGTTSTPTLAFFGSSSAKKYNPAAPRNLAKQGACPYGRTFEKRCSILRSCPTGACMRDHKMAEKST